MTGPPINYVSPDPFFNYWDTIISQYANSPRLVALIDYFFQAVDQIVNIDAFFDNIWNVLDTDPTIIDDPKYNYGLDVWGRIVGAPRVISVPNGNYFGQEDPTSSFASGDPYNVSPFYNNAALTANYALPNDQYRLWILAKAAANICDGGISNTYDSKGNIIGIGLNQILLSLFPGRGDCHVIDNLDLTMTYKFNFATTAVEQTVVRQLGAFVTPAGVSASYSF